MLATVNLELLTQIGVGISLGQDSHKSFQLFKSPRIHFRKTSVEQIACLEDRKVILGPILGTSTLPLHMNGQWGYFLKKRPWCHVGGE